MKRLNPLSFALFVLLGLIYLNVVSSTDPTTSTVKTVKERLMKLGNQLSITIFLEPPTANEFLNMDLVDNSVKKMNLSSEFTKLIREWNPRLLALDPTTPYYFSTYSSSSSTDNAEEDEINLLSYFRAMESNTSTARPFLHVLPESYRHALPLLSIFQCNEYLNDSSNPFFHNVDLLVGPGQTEYPFQLQSNDYAYLYCPLFGWPHFLALNQTKESSITYDAETLLSSDDLSGVDFISTTVAPGSCVFVPPGWVVGAQLNNSLSLVFTVHKREAPKRNETHYEPWPCTATDEMSLDSISFDVSDPFNLTDIGLVVYFYQYLNPPMFDKQYTAETFFERFRQDQNVSQIVAKWTPELIKLIKESLFTQLDIDQDGQYSAQDYFNIKKSNLNQIQNSIYEILDNLRQVVLAQYGDINATLTKLAEKMSSIASSSDPRAALESVIDELPEAMKIKLGEKNAEIAEMLDRIERRKQREQRQRNPNSQGKREDDATLLFDRTTDDQTSSDARGEDQEEEIIAEPAADVDEETHRTEL